MKPRIRSNIVYLLIIQGGGYLPPIILLPYLGRTLGVESYGTLVYFQTIGLYMMIVVDFGINLTGTRTVSLAKEDGLRLSRVYSSTMVARAVLAMIGIVGALMAAYMLKVNATQFYVLVGTLVGILGHALFPVWLFQGLEQMKLLVANNIVARVSGMLFAFLVVRGKDDIALAALSLAAPNILIAISAQFSIFRHGLVELRAPKMKEAIQSLTNGWPILLATIVGSFYSHFNSLLVEHLYGASTLAKYAMAEKIRLAAQGLMMPIVSAYYPRLCVGSQSGNRDQWKEDHRRASKLIIVAGLSIAAILYICGPTLISTTLGTEYKESASMLQLQALIVPIVCSALLYGHLGLLALGYSGDLTKIYYRAAACHLIYIYPMTLFFRGEGTTYSLLGTELLAAVLIYKRYQSVLSADVSGRSLK